MYLTAYKIIYWSLPPPQRPAIIILLLQAMMDSGESGGVKAQKIWPIILGDLIRFRTSGWTIIIEYNNDNSNVINIIGRLMYANILLLYSVKIIGNDIKTPNTIPGERWKTDSQYIVVVWLEMDFRFSHLQNKTIQFKMEHIVGLCAECSGAEVRKKLSNSRLYDDSIRFI